MSEEPAHQEALRDDVLTRIGQRLPAAVARLTAPLEEVHGLRDERLRPLLHVARERSSWHRGRLAGVELDQITGETMDQLPTMTKTDLMANWDEIVCHDTLTLEMGNQYLHDVAAGAPRLFAVDDVVVIATGGSTGRRGVIALDGDGFADTGVASMSHDLWGAQHGLITTPTLQARLTASSPVHMSGAVSRFMSGRSPYDMRTLPPTLPIGDIVDGLNETQPSHLFGYASILHRVALEARASRLRIAPQGITQAGEALLPETRSLLEDTWGVPVRNMYASSESYFGESTCDGSPWLHLSEDVAVLEVVDRDNRPVPPGRRGAKLLVTNVVNTVLPLIRYEVTDELTVLEGNGGSPWTGRRVADPAGRMDDGFLYGSVWVHPQVFRTVFAAAEDVAEYQVRQTPTGADVTVAGNGGVDAAALSAALHAGLAGAGVADATIRMSVVAAIERQAETGKLRRFLPLPQASAN